MTTHELKIAPRYYRRIVVGTKTAELRINDRDYQCGDLIELHEYEADVYYDGPLTLVITHVLAECEGLQPGYVMLSFKIGGAE